MTYTTVIMRHYQEYRDEYDTLREALCAMYGQSENLDTGYPAKIICPDGSEIGEDSWDRWAAENLYYLPNGGYRIDKNGNPQTRDAALQEQAEQQDSYAEWRLAEAIEIVKAAGYEVHRCDETDEIPVDITEVTDA